MKNFHNIGLLILFFSSSKLLVAQVSTCPPKEFELFLEDSIYQYMPIGQKDISERFYIDFIYKDGVLDIKSSNKETYIRKEYIVSNFIGMKDSFKIESLNIRYIYSIDGVKNEFKIVNKNIIACQFSKIDLIKDEKKNLLKK